MIRISIALALPGENAAEVSFAGVVCCSLSITPHESLEQDQTDPN